MNEKLIEFIENSFLKDLVKEDTVTDISYNGIDIYYKDNLKGRIKSDIKVESKEAYDFIRQIANLTDSLFSVTNPILDVSIGRYRINATHFSLSRKNREKVITFAIRIGFDQLRIKDNGEFISKKCVKLIDFALNSKSSIIISGKTGSGKTELQKFIISRLKENTRLITIDNINELETDYFTKNIDSLTWVLTYQNSHLSFDDLIKNALRSNPDWLIIGEVRGKEMLALLNSAMSGHPTITTLHSKTALSTYNRMARMCMIGNESLSYKETLIDVFDHFKLIIHVKSYFDKVKNMYVRYVDSMGTNESNKYYPLFKYPNTYFKLPNSIRDEFELEDNVIKDYNEGI